MCGGGKRCVEKKGCGEEGVWRRGVRVRCEEVGVGGGNGISVGGGGKCGGWGVGGVVEGLCGEKGRGVCEVVAALTHPMAACPPMWG